jgi:integrase
VSAFERWAAAEAHPRKDLHQLSRPQLCARLETVIDCLDRLWVQADLDRGPLPRAVGALGPHGRRAGRCCRPSSTPGARRWEAGTPTPRAAWPRPGWGRRSTGRTGTRNWPIASSSTARSARGRDRTVPRIGPVPPPAGSRTAFESRLERLLRKLARRAKKSGQPIALPRITPYDFRRTHSNWMEAAGIPRTRRQLYRGHGPKDVGDLYEEHEVTAFLAEDRDRLLAYVKRVSPSGVRLHA